MVDLTFEHPRALTYLGDGDWDTTIEVPSEDELAPPRFSFTNEAESRKGVAAGRPAVSFNLMQRDEAILVWIRERKEWVAISHRSWRESPSDIGHSYDGPYALDETCARKLMEAYGVPLETVALTEARRLSPEQLDHHAE